MPPISSGVAVCRTRMTGASFASSIAWPLESAIFPEKTPSEAEIPVASGAPGVSMS
ncbi:MAG: hypothetical protein WAK75_08260 [Methanoregula sp.]|uniref:hypothetical protein n=1 Tax=Methanoregula sp. TaxID=2052170 RepID=UPI003BAE65C4